MKRLAQPRTAGALLVLVVAVCVLLTSVSNAAGLSLLAQSGGVFAQTNARCTDGPLQVTPSGTPNAAGQFNRVTVSGDFGSCTVGNISLYLKSNPHTVLFSEQVTVSGNSVVLPTSSSFTPPASDAGGIVLGLNGWLVPARWSYTPPAPSGSSCIVTRPNGSTRPGASCSVRSIVPGQVADHWEGNKVVTRRADVTVSFSQSGWVDGDRVRLSLDMSTATGFPAGWTHARSAPFSWGNLEFVSRCAEMPNLVGNTTYWVNAGNNALSFGYLEDRTRVSPSTILNCGP